MVGKFEADRLRRVSSLGASAREYGPPTPDWRTDRQGPTNQAPQHRGRVPALLVCSLRQPAGLAPSPSGGRENVAAGDNSGVCVGQLHPLRNGIGGQMQPSNNYPSHINSSSPVTYPMRSSYGSGIPTMPQQQQGKPRDTWLHPTLPRMHEPVAFACCAGTAPLTVVPDAVGVGYPPTPALVLSAGPSRPECYSGGSLRYALHIVRVSCAWVQAGRALDTCRASMFSRKCDNSRPCLHLTGSYVGANFQPIPAYSTYSTSPR